MPEHRYDVCGVGNALVDALVEIDDDRLLADLGLVRGNMHLVDDARWQEVFARVRAHPVEIHPGGSCANTVAGVALLGGRATFCGLVGDDPLGRQYAERMEEIMGGHHLRVDGQRPTGKCLALISRSDAQRTMLTDLGVAPSLAPEQVFADVIGASRYLHVEGYLFTGSPIRESALRALEAARSAGTRVSFDLSDPWVVAAHRDQLLDVLRGYADVAFLNEEEARAMTGLDADGAIAQVAEWVDVAVVKLGSRGSLVMSGGEVVRVPVHRVVARDTTGAGDAYAAGFLYGLSRGWDLPRCGDVASRLAAATVAQIGAVVRDRAMLAELGLVA